MYRYTICILFIIYSNGYAGDSLNTDSLKIKYSVSLAGKYCYPGYSIAPALEIGKNKHSFVLGPVFLLSDFYVPGDVTTGLQLGWRLKLFGNLKKMPLGSFLTAEYQIIPYKIQFGLPKKKKTNYIHEINAGYGIQYRLTDHVAIINSISVGIYIESYYNRFTDRHEIITGMDTLVYLGIIYVFAE